MKRTLALIPALLLSACVVGPNYQRPASSTAAAGSFVTPAPATAATP
ncbi:MAG: hypothetical protein JWL96_4249, partial [Sphingomonas bacterium]|nr:hypothetical protein [Sphingomonas bacterium]